MPSSTTEAAPVTTVTITRGFKALATKYKRATAELEAARSNAWAAIPEERENGASLKMIADELGVSVGSVQYALSTLPSA